jgi:hypothetical protein
VAPWITVQPATMIGFKQIEFFDHTGLFNVVSQQKKGSFCGVEEGRQILKTLIEKTNWDSEESVFEFANDIVARLQAGYRQSKPQPVSVNDQLNDIHYD